MGPEARFGKKDEKIGKKNAKSNCGNVKYVENIRFSIFSYYNSFNETINYNYFNLYTLICKLIYISFTMLW